MRLVERSDFIARVASHTGSVCDGEDIRQNKLLENGRTLVRTNIYLCIAHLGTKPIPRTSCFGTPSIEERRGLINDRKNEEGRAKQDTASSKMGGGLRCCILRSRIHSTWRGRTHRFRTP